MGRRKKLIPHFERDVAFICENPLELLKSGNRLDYVPKGQFVETANNQFVPPLVDGWKNRVTTIAAKTTSAEDFASIELITKQYVAERVARQVNPIEWRDTITRTERLAKASKLLLDELNDWQGGYNLMWKRVEQISGMGGVPLTHDDVYPVVSRFYSALSGAVIQAQSEHRQGGTLSHWEPWRALVTCLAELWEGAGGTATAAKSVRGGYANPSPFVCFVWLVMMYVVPKPLREHTASKGAMQTAISKVLAKRNIKLTGPFPKNRASNKSRPRRG